MYKHRLALFIAISLSATLTADDGLELSRQTLAARINEIERNNDLQKFKTLDEWQDARPKLRAQLFEMLGLEPLPLRTDLKATITGTLEDADVVVEKLHFQSRPGLYVTANLYRPKNVDKPLPAVLYVCGHGQVKENGISYGNKAYAQNHPAWYASHGYISMAIDTVQLGEIEGMHHGLYRYNRWDWPSLGYTPAGVEAWNASRAVDYLLTRPEVDKERIGITGRSGGGAYSWYAAAIDPRIQVVVPVAGITDLRDHVLGNCVSGHCDCMYFANRYGWDYQTLAAMTWPRPLQIGNTDDDPIFPIGGVERIHTQLRHLYQLKDKSSLGIQWTFGGHEDTQELQIGAFVWFDLKLQGARRPITDIAAKRFAPAQLRVFDTLPKDERVTTVQDGWIQSAPTKLPENEAAWLQQKAIIRAEVEACCRGRLPFANVEQPNRDDDPSPVAAFQPPAVPHDSWTLQKTDLNLPFDSKCRVITLTPPKSKALRWDVVILGSAKWRELELVIAGQTKDHIANELAGQIAHICDLELKSNSAVAIVQPEATGPWYWNDKTKEGLHMRRSYLLVGWSLEGRQIQGVADAVSLLSRQNPESQVRLHGDAETSMIVLHAAILQSSRVKQVTVTDIPSSYRDGFNLLGILQRFDIDQVLAAIADDIPIHITHECNAPLATLNRVSDLRKWPNDRFEVVNR